MTFSEFKYSLEAATPPDGVNHALSAMWFDAKGDWDTAHHEAQVQDDADGAWVHAYLHRVEGDAGNAAYWYRKAGRPVCEDTLQEEWQGIVTYLLDASSRQ